jgi:enolase-phosphatase E1
VIRGLLLDVEGTTTSLSFVHATLFPYAAARLPDFVRSHAQEPEVARLLGDARAYAGAALDDEALIQRMLAWIEADQKITPLKALQGLIWAEGYRAGDFHGHVYPDVAPALRRWQAAGLRIHIFSSGSVQAQQLLFAHTGDGDLTPLISGYFDTRIGGKRHTDSYRRIAEATGIAPEALLFVSDQAEELDAAAVLRMRTAVVRREGVNGPFGDHPVFTDFDALEHMLLRDALA